MRRPAGASRRGKRGQWSSVLRLDRTEVGGVVGIAGALVSRLQRVRINGTGETHLARVQRDFYAGPGLLSDEGALSLIEAVPFHPLHSVLNQLGATFQIQLSLDVLAVSLDRLGAQPKFPGYLSSAATTTDQTEDL